MTAVFKREFKAYFRSPIGYIVITVFYMFMGLIFSSTYGTGSPDITSVISSTTTISMFFIPVLTMRLFCEDRRQKIDQALFTAPVKLTSIVLGKFSAAVSVYAICFAPTVIFEIIFASNISVNVMAYIYSLIGILLLGAALISIGMFVSCLTESSAVAAILSIVINLVVILLPLISSMIKDNRYFGWLATAFDKMAFMNAYESFNANIFKVQDIVYFISICAIFLFLCVRSLEKRRWS